MKYVAVFLIVTLLAGCASPYTPLIDRPGASYEEDIADCQRHADNEAGPGTGAIVGVIIGGIIGAVIGHQLGLRDEGAKFGAMMGGIRGAGDGANNQMEIVRRCMAGRGHNVLR